MIHFEGDQDFAQPLADLYGRLCDARFLVQCIPDASIEGQPEQNQAVCTVRPGFAFVRGTLETTLRVVEAVPEQTIRLSLASQGIASSSEVEAVLSLAAQGGGTRVHWSVDVLKLGGLLRAVPTGLVRGAAQKVIEDVWVGVRNQLAGQGE